MQKLKTVQCAVVLLLMLFLLLLFLVTNVSSNRNHTTSVCRYVDKYSISELLSNEGKRQQFLMEMAHWEGKFNVHKLGLNVLSGLTYDGHGINYVTGELHDPAHGFSAASKECIHVALLALGLSGNNSMAYAFLKSSLESTVKRDASKMFKWNSVEDYIIDILTRKILSYEKWNKKYPGFGGFLPWYTVSDAGMDLAWDWQDRVPSLDNGELIWSLAAAALILQEAGYAPLAQRYMNQVILMAETAITIFYENEGRIRCVTQILNITAQPTRENYQNWQDPSGETCFLDDPYEGELMAFFMDLFCDWEANNYTKDEREKIWIYKRRKLQKATYSSKKGPIDVERGWWFSSHEKWKYMMLPYTDIPINRRVFLNGERARVHFSREHGYGGLFASVTNVSSPGNYHPNYVSATGIQEIAFQRVLTNNLVTPYAAFPLLIENITKPFGLAWYASMLKGSKMQNPFGSTEAISIDGTLISPVLTWDSKITSILAASGGITDLTRIVLMKRGYYDRFSSIIKREWERVFTDLRGEDIAFVGPEIDIPNILPDFTTCGL
jgi:hypothetical protein